MPLDFLKKIASYIGAKSAGAILPVVSRRPELLGPLVDKLKDTALENVHKKSKLTPRLMERKIRAIEMVWEAIRRHLPRLAPQVQRKIIFNMWYHQLTRGEPVREKYHAETGEWPPTLLAISPSMRCNLKCEGCYAAEYEKFGELTAEEFIDIVRQGKEDFGIYFYTILGGEPTVWPPLFECLEAHSDAFFQVYTHGQLIDDAMAKKFAELGNVMIAISVEGTPEETDARRGPGAYERITESMKRLSDAGVAYGFSATHSTKNHKSIAGEEFYKRMVDLGCAFGWVFQYCPIGRAPSMDLVPTPEQRVERWKTIRAVREKHPIALYDFWNDGEMTEGCMAYGRRYMHILPSGHVEPCVFVHFAQDNIREKPLKEIIQSEFFRDARKRAPFDKDHRAPCSFIDSPDFLKEMVEKYKLVPTHEGAISIVTQFHGPLCERARRYRKLLEDLDSEEKHEEEAAQRV